MKAFPSKTIITKCNQNLSDLVGDFLPVNCQKWIEEAVAEPFSYAAQTLFGQKPTEMIPKPIAALMASFHCFPKGN